MQVDKGEQITGSNGTGGGGNRFTGIYSPTEHSYKRAQLVLSSGFSDLVIASSQANNNHGSTLTFATYNPSNASDYKKWVINQGNWGSRKQMLDFGYSNSGSRINPHSNINSTDTVLTLDGVNKRVGIGTMSPGHKLQVNGNAMIGESGETLKIRDIGHSNWAGIAHTSRASANDYALIQNSSGATILNSKSNQVLHFRQGNSDKMVIKNGRVGIGTTNPGDTLHVNGVFRQTYAGNTFRMWQDSQRLIFNLQKCYHGSNKSMSWDGDTNWDSYSDRRLKTNIEEEKNILKRLTQLKVKNFNWKDDPNNKRKMIGFIAQDVQPLFPTLVKENNDKNSNEKKLTIPYASFGVLAVGAIKELKDEKDVEIYSLKEEKRNRKNC